MVIAYHALTCRLTDAHQLRRLPSFGTILRSLALKGRQLHALVGPRRDAPRSPFAHCEQHFTFTNGFHRVRYVGIQHEGLATGKLIPPSFRVNH
jgi:hypothetical protein